VTHTHRGPVPFCLIRHNVDVATPRIFETSVGDSSLSSVMAIVPFSHCR